MGKLIDLNEYREKRAMTDNLVGEIDDTLDLTDDQLALLLFDIMFMDMLSETPGNPDISDAVMARIKDEIQEEE